MSLQPSQSAASAWFEALDAPPSAPPPEAASPVVSVTFSRGELARVIREAIAADAETRLSRAESVLAGLSAGDREALCEWLGGMLHRPPLERPTRAFAPMRDLIDALWWDIAYRTPDPLEPDALSPAILPNHPWGEGAES